MQPFSLAKLGVWGNLQLAKIRSERQPSAGGLRAIAAIFTPTPSLLLVRNEVIVVLNHLYGPYVFELLEALFRCISLSHILEAIYEKQNVSF